MDVIVAKFGGTSLADAVQIQKAVSIVKSDPRRRYVVVSAPGKRSGADHKLTDLLYGLGRGMKNLSSDQIFEMISDRFRSIVDDLGLQLDLTTHLDLLHKAAIRQKDINLLVSRGEYLSGRILSAALGYVFVDAGDIIRFDTFGQFDMMATKQCANQLTGQAEGYVIPGFYGSRPDGTIKTFSRGGSDFTGAIIAALVGADLYENWTDVSGLLMVDPRVVPDARRIDIVTYKELRELTYMGANVLHDEVIFPLRSIGIPISVRNTNRPDDEGTLIVPDKQAPQRRSGTIVGIAGRKGFSVITIEKSLMNREVGFIRRVCGVLEENAVNIEHIPGGIDTLSIIVSGKLLGNGKLDRIKKGIECACKPDSINVTSDMALICTVGHAMVHTPGVASRLFQAIASANVNVRMIDQGSSELSIIIGVENDDYETAVRAIYGMFVR